MTLKRKSVLSVFAIATIALIVSVALTFSAFTATATNQDNGFASGTVVLGDNAAGAALYAAGGVAPGFLDAKCVTVTYTGSLDALVRLYGTTTSAAGKNLAPYLDLVVERGSFPGAAPADGGCTGFTGTVLYGGTLAGYPGTYAAGVKDPATFATGTSTVYRIGVALQDDDAAQDRDATTRFTFEARDSANAGS
jgi:hypothetical protein